MTLICLKSSGTYIVCGVAEEVGRPNIADYFPALRLIDPQGVRKKEKDLLHKNIWDS